MTKKSNGTLRTIILIVTLLGLFASGVAAWTVYGGKVETNEDDIAEARIVLDKHEARLDAHDVAMVEIKYIREDIAEQKVISKEILVELKELRK